MFSRRTMGSVLAIIFAAGCSGDTTAPDVNLAANAATEDYAIRTSVSDVILQAGRMLVTGDIPFQFTNLSDRAITIPNCNGTYPILLEKQVGGKWVETWSSADGMMGCISPGIVLAPGEAHSDTASIFGGQEGTNYFPRFTDPSDGTYRLSLLRAFWDYEGPMAEGVQVPERLRSSSGFAIRFE